jgi:hypothetical protein
MRKRWTAAGMLVAEQQFRRIIGYRDLATLVIAVERHALRAVAEHPDRRDSQRARYRLTVNSPEPAAEVLRRSGHPLGHPRGPQPWQPVAITPRRAEGRTRRYSARFNRLLVIMGISGRSRAGASKRLRTAA